MERVGIYCRLSDEDKDKKNKNEESESIRNQRSMLISYANERGWSIYKIYVDEDYSGSDNKRPSWNKMLKDAENRKFDIILCKTQSRFSRSMEVIEKYLHGLFLEWGIRFISLIDNADTEIKGNKKSRQINSLVNEWFLEDLSENIRSVFLEKMKKGEFLASFAPYGYKKDPERRGHLVIDEGLAETVSRIFHLSDVGYGTSKIARMLNDDNIPNPRKQQEIYKLRKTKMYKNEENGIWSAASVSGMLHNRVYCGDTVGGMFSKLNYKSKKIVKNTKDKWIVVKNTHNPIIDRDLFLRVQAGLALKRKSTGLGKPHLLAQRVFCFYCGKSMQKTHAHTHIDYLRCRNKYYYTENLKCASPNIRSDVIIAEIKEKLIPLISVLPACKYKKLNNMPDINNKITELKKKNSKLKEVIKSLYLDKTAGLITKEQFREFNIDFSNSIRESEKEINSIKASSYKAPELSFEELLNSEDFLRELINNFIFKIIFGEYDEESNEYILKIVYNHI